jgi:hypothetical protein
MVLTFTYQTQFLESYEVDAEEVCEDDGILLHLTFLSSLLESGYFGGTGCDGQH